MKFYSKGVLVNRMKISRYTVLFHRVPLHTNQWYKLAIKSHLEVLLKVVGTFTIGLLFHHHSYG